MKKIALNCVLIVEDDIGSNQNITFFLRDKFNKVISAYDGLEGWSLYNDEVPDLIITDIEMPHMDGLELVQKIRQKDFITPIIVLSAYTHTEYLKRAIPLNLIDYIVKPLTFQKLSDVLHRLRKKYSFVHQHLPIDKAGAVSYDWDGKFVYVNNEHLHLTNKEIQMIELLLNNQGQVLNYEEIGDMLYPDSLDSKNSIKCIIRDIRKKIPSIAIENLPKWGYKLL